MPKYLVAMVWFGQAEAEIKVVEGKNIREVEEEYEHNQNNIIVAKITPKIKKELKKALQ